MKCIDEKTFEARILIDSKFNRLVKTFVLLVKESVNTGDELFWRKVQNLTNDYPEEDVDICIFVILMCLHYEDIEDQAWKLFKSQETLTLGEDYVMNSMSQFMNN